MEEVKLQTGGYLIKCKTWLENGRLFVDFPYHKGLKDEIKTMEGAKFHGFDEVNPRKVWSVPLTQRNLFQLEFLKGGNPYALYDATLPRVDFPPRHNHSRGVILPPLKHQPDMTAHILHRRQCIVAGEMGTCKTLCAIRAMELLSEEFRKKHGKEPVIWYVAPRSALREVERQFFVQWKTHVRPTFFTYERLVKTMANWESGTPAPFALFLDEASKVKTLTTQRTRAARAVADAIRAEWGHDGYVVLMTGTPSPKSPTDWYSLAEVACPGFLKEGDIYKFQQRLAVVVKEQNMAGVSYPKIKTWRNSELKCNICGELESAPIHQTAMPLESDPHTFVPSKNEVLFLAQRLKGLVSVYWKKDCLDLPDKFYRTIECKPEPSMIRAASLITKTSATVIEGLTRLRELSDGFQYVKIKQGKETCERCRGTGKTKEYREIPDSCPNCKGCGYTHPLEQCSQHLPERTPTEVPCPRCGGTGEQDKVVRSTQEIKSPKETVLADLLDEYDDVGRIVVYAGFTGAIDKCVRICQAAGWHVIRVDSGHEQVTDEKGVVLPIEDWLGLFQDQLTRFPRVAFVAHPGSAGMGLTLTASPVIIYYSNDFNGENRVQSEDRIHRPGMDINRGATIIDILHLPSDYKVLENLRNKRKLELMSLGEIAEAFGETDVRVT